jgi:hypothetical protein
MTKLPAKDQTLVDIARERVDRLGPFDQDPVRYILDQLDHGASPEYHGGERPEREDAEWMVEHALLDHMRHYLSAAELTAVTSKQVTGNYEQRRAEEAALLERAAEAKRARRAR